MRISDWSSDVCSSDLIGRGRVLREGTSVALLSLGGRLQECLKAADDLAARGLSTTVADARFAKPIDTALLRRLAAEHAVLITVEEGAIGGFAAQVLQYLATEGLLDRGLAVRRSEEHPSEPQSLMRTSYAVFCLKK